MHRFASERDRELFKTVVHEKLFNAFSLSAKVADALLDHQVSELENLLIEFKPYKVQQRYRMDVRVKKKTFFNDMAKLLVQKQKMADRDSLYVKLPNEYGNEDKFQIPAPKGSLHLIDELTKFLLSYYEDHPPFKYIKGLMPPITEDYILNTNLDIMNRPHFFDESVLEHAKFLAFPLQILSKIREFKQFPKGQRDKSTVTEKQARFIVAFLAIIDYEKWRLANFNSINVNVKPVNETRLTSEVKVLRNRIIAYQKVIDKAPDWR